MSKIGKQPISIPSNINVSIKDSTTVTITKGDQVIEYTLPTGLTIEQEDNVLSITIDESRIKELRPMWGLYRSLINNSIIGLSEGFKKRLEINGIGYRAELQGQNLKLALGYSHPVVIEPPQGITFAVEGNNVIIVTGYDKQVVGQISANIRAKRPPEPYKGKGIKYSDEIIRRKQGKSN